MSKELEALEYLKENKRRHWLDNDNSSECLKIVEAALKEHAQYKTIEDELGIDLPTLIKAQTQGFYIKDCLGISQVRLSEWRFNLIKKEVHRVQYNSHYYFKDYGKTWALTREELEHKL